MSYFITFVRIEYNKNYIKRDIKINNKHTFKERTIKKLKQIFDSHFSIQHEVGNL